MKHSEQAEYDEETDGFIFHSKYNIDKFTRKLIAHFNDGGLAHDAVIAGVCEVSQQSIMRWRDPNSPHFKEAFARVINEYQFIAAAVTDTWHRESARGDRKDANASVLNRRAERLFDLTETKDIRQTNEIHFESLEEIDAEIERVREEQEDIE